MIRLIIVIVLALLIFGGAGATIYHFMIKPEKEVEAELRQAEQEAEPLPPPDPGADVYATILAESGDEFTLRDRLIDFIERYPESSKVREAKERIGRINMDFLFSSTPGPGKEPYTVVRGDALVKIATKTGCNAELIMRSNNLATINLSIDQQLLIPKIDPKIVIDRETRTLTLYNGNAFLKEYALTQEKLPSARQGDTTVTEKIAMKDGKRVAFGTKDYAESQKSVLLGGGLTLQETPEEGTAAPPNAILLGPEEFDEVYVLVSRGTPVTIR